MKGEYYTKSGRLLKEMEVLETGLFSSFEAATVLRISDTMKSDSETIMMIEELEIDVRISDAVFSLDELSW